MTARLRGDTMYRHCMETGIPHALIEVRQDLIARRGGVAEWARAAGADLRSRSNADPACTNTGAIRRAPALTTI